MQVLLGWSGWLNRSSLECIVCLDQAAPGCSGTGSRRVHGLVCLQRTSGRIRKQRHIRRLQPKGNERLIGGGRKPAIGCSQGGKPDHNDTWMRGLTCKHRRLGTSKNQFGAPRRQRLRHPAPILIPFRCIFDGNLADYISFRHRQLQVLENAGLGRLRRFSAKAQCIHLRT